MQPSRTERQHAQGRGSAGNGLRRGLRVAAVIAAGGLASACNTYGHLPTETYVPRHVSERHPITVHDEVVELEVPVARGSSRLSDENASRVAQFIDGYKSAGSGPLVVSRPSRSRHAVETASTAADVARLAEEVGVSRTQVVHAAYTPAKGTASPIVISYERWRATGPECGDWSRNLAVTYDNEPHPNFGCASQNNLAAMVSNPRDLVMPRTMTPPDAARRDVVFDKYRRGETTESQRAESAGGATVSEVGQ